MFVISVYFFFFKQKTAYEMRISDWSSDVCSSDLENQDWHKLSDQTQAGQEVEIKRLDASNDPDQPQHFVVRAAIASGRIEGSLQDITARTKTKIGRAAYWERVCQYV